MRRPLLSKIFGIGIDVSKATIVVCFRTINADYFTKDFPNSTSGISSLIKFMQDHHITAKIVMESTGRYHLLPAFLLAQAKYHVYVINPLQAKKYATSSIRRNKTDKVDAHHLAEMSVKEDHLPYQFNMDKMEIALRQKIGLLHSLEKQIQRMQQIMKEYERCIDQFNIPLSECEKNIKESINKMKIYKNKIEKEIQQIIYSQTRSRHRKETTILESIPGLSPYLATLIINFFSHKKGAHVKQWIAYSGMDVTVRESGTWKGRGKLSKRGNRYIRKRLFSGAWGAVMNDEKVRKFYEYLKIQQGRSHKEALLIIARKLLRISYALLKSGEFFTHDKAIFLQYSSTQ